MSNFKDGIIFSLKTTVSTFTGSDVIEHLLQKVSGEVKEIKALSAQENDFRLSSKSQLSDFCGFRHSSKTLNSEFDGITDTASTL